jgi:hypothetical protein
VLLEHSSAKMMNPTKNFKGVKLYFRNEYQDFYSIVGTLVLTDFEALFYSDDGKRDMQVDRSGNYFQNY